MFQHELKQFRKNFIFSSQCVVLYTTTHMWRFDDLDTNIKREQDHDCNAMIVHTYATLEPGSCKMEIVPQPVQGWPVSTSWSRRNKFCKYWVMERLLKCPSRAVQSCVGSELEISSEYELLCNLHMKFICPLFWIGEYNLWLMNSSYKYAPQAKKIQSSAWNY